MPPSPFNLPSVPHELKAMSPYLQRAEELKNKDPIMAYWSAYYAAQVGIGLKVKDPAARSFLFELLGALEHMKKEIGPNDAIDEESVSSAFVENFALKVFSSADNEDRRGEATRATAKKFLAAANFLEILSVFESSAPESSSSNSEKIRYAKWKAADIAKAFREGRKPTPGPAGGIEPPTFPPTVSPPGEEVPNTEVTPVVPPSFDPGLPSESAPSPPAFTRATPPPPQLGSLPPSPFSHLSSADPLAQDNFFHTGFVDPRIDAVTPGGWSTAATPGSPAVFRFDEADIQSATPTTRAWVSEELEGMTDDRPELVLPVEGGEISPIGSTGGQKQVRFSPSVADELPSPTYDEDMQGPLDVTDRGVPQDSLSLPSAPSFFPGHGVQIPPSAPSLPPPPPPVEFYSYESQSPTYISPPQIPYPPVPPPTRAIHPIPEAATITQAPPVELTPQVIARIQKHCKFAISALDYEDAAQARKELRAALRMLGD